jgi:hypothetical protein
MMDVFQTALTKSTVSSKPSSHSTWTGAMLTAELQHLWIQQALTLSKLPLFCTS